MLAHNQMSDLCNNQKQSRSNFRQLLNERIEQANPRRKLTADEAKRLAKLEAIAEKLKHEKNVQNRQLQTWSTNAVADYRRRDDGTIEVL